MLALAAFAIAQLTNLTPGVKPQEPQLAASANLVAMVYGAEHSIYVVTSTDQGAHFSKPVAVSNAPVLPLTRHRGPHIAISQGVLVVTAIVGQTEAHDAHSHGLPSDGDLFAWRSLDHGKTWSKGVRVNDVPASPREGLHTLTADSKGDLYTAWLDNRKAGTRLYGSSSSDSGATWSKSQLLYESPDGTICQCCHPTVSFDANGGLDVMWRNALGGSRDMYLIHSQDRHNFTAPQKLGQGTWKLDACPMDGGGIAHVNGKTVTVWRREGDIFLAEPGQPEKKIGSGKDVAIAASHAKIYVAWIQNSHLQTWVGDKTLDGKTLDGKATGIPNLPGSDAAYPSLVGLPGGGVLVAWESNGAISVSRLP